LTRKVDHMESNNEDLNSNIKDLTRQIKEKDDLIKN
jgi:prefoldin subunit 5